MTHDQWFLRNMANKMDTNSRCLNHSVTLCNMHCLLSHVVTMTTLQEVCSVKMNLFIFTVEYKMTYMVPMLCIWSPSFGKQSLLGA